MVGVGCEVDEATGVGARLGVGAPLEHAAITPHRRTAASRDAAMPLRPMVTAEIALVTPDRTIEILLSQLPGVDTDR
jgi:hypothetical protein